MTGIKILGTAAAIQIAQALPQNMAAFEKLGIGALLALGVIALWNDGRKRQEKFETIARETVSAVTENTEVMREVKAVIEKCRKG